MKLIGANTRRLSLADYNRVAIANNIPVAHLRAVVKIEAAGAGFNSHGLLKLLYEYHIAYRRSNGKVRASLAKAGLAVKKWGAKKYPRSMAARHSQVSKAVIIAGMQGYEFASYGLPQMMGFNHRVCGFPTAKAMVKYMLVSEANQLEVMIRFLKGTGLIDKLRRGDWKGLAFGYNGPGYAKHGYDKKLAHAAAMYARNPNKGALRKPTTKAPTKPDEDVKKAQEWLATLGYKPGKVDGWMGDNTAGAVLQFQRSHPELTNDGLIGPHTLAALEKAVELKVKPPQTVDEPSAVVVVGGLLAGALSYLGAMPVYVWLGLGAVVLVILGLLLRKYLAHRNEYAPEIEHQKNIKSGKLISVEPWADRRHPADAMPLASR